MMVRTNEPVRSARLPQQRSASPGADRLKGFVALLAILAIVGGVPYVLLRFFGTPWPDELPSRDVLFDQLGIETVLGIITFFIWVAWLHFVICLIAEAAAEIRGHGLSPRIPLGGGSQTLARRLISSVVLIAGAASVSLPVASAVTTSAAVPTAITATQGGDQGAGTSFRQTEARSTVLSGNHTHTGVRTNSDDKGQVVKYTEVRPPQGRNYDCLWDIAERYLGEGRRYKEIYELNKNKLQPDGRRLTNPDLIMPGWQVRLPADAKGPGVHTVRVKIDHTTTTTRTVKPSTNTPAGKKTTVVKPGTNTTTETPPAPSRWFEKQGTEAGSPIRIGSAINDPNAKNVKPGNPEISVAPHGPGATESEKGDPAAGGTQVPEVVPVAEDSGFDATQAGIYGFGATLLAAGLALALKRRRGWAQGPGPKAAGHRQTEIGLRLASDIPTAQFVDNALRQLGADMTEAGRPMPKVVAALVTDRALTLVLDPYGAQPAPPAPWQGIADGSRWTLRRAYAPSGDVAAPAPYPTLVTIGRNADGATVLVDLDTANGIVSFGGVNNASRDVVGSLAVELATNLWSEGAHVSMVGFGDDLSSLAPSRLSYWVRLDDAIAEVSRRTEAQVQACGRRNLGSVAEARMAQPDAALWGAEIIFVSAPPSPEEQDQLNRLAADSKRSIAVVVVGDVISSPWRFVVDEKNQAVCRLLGLEVDAHSINPAQFADLVALFEAAETDALDKRRAEQNMPAYEFSTTDLSQPAPVEVDLLGPVEVDARGTIEDGRITLATEIVAFLASQDYGVHPNVLAGAIWPRGISEELRNAALEHTRRWVGVDAMYSDESGRWMLNRSIVRVDWDVFRTLAKQASMMDDPRRPLSTALSLVHGPAWTNLPAGRYSWLAASGIERRMVEAVVDAALKLAEASLEHNDGNLARTALQTGLSFSPASEELWRATLRLASHFGTTADVTNVATQMYAALTKHGGPRGAESETDALVDELLPGYHRPIRVA
ncbi:transcriptional activator [Kribbella antiqua]|uniref:Transcriptional activator n=1 Tax=Kribbella antiqua TaxID=2512217 RepID=A0A4R2IZN1_9ACTN|nr:LysM peptidoglycan-binding domain-containing protein [Kribbella antiqua]TCO50006.1 transcriptional activator [Kribbella antiqua]